MQSLAYSGTLQINEVEKQGENKGKKGENKDM